MSPIALPSRASSRPPAAPTAGGLVVIALALVPGLLAPAAVRPAAAGPSEQVPIGPRGIAMGGAYTSLAQDASAMYWNPAGLARIGHQEIAGSYANLFQSDVKDNFAAFVLPISRRHAVGIDWYHSGFEDPELDFGENRFDLSYAAQVHPLLSAGITAKYLTRSTALDGATLSRGSGVGLDFGILATPRPGIRLGAIAQDLFDTRLRYSEGGSTIAFPRNLRVGASYTWRDRATLAADVDDRWHLGVEARPLDPVALRAGMEDDREGPDGPTYTAGVGFQAGIFRLDYAYVMHPTLEATSHFGLSLAFNFNPSRVRIESIRTDEIYASLYKTYARDSLGQVVLRNLHDESIEVTLGVRIPELMDAPSESRHLLRRGAAQPLPLRAVLPDRIMSRVELLRTPIEVVASYTSERLDRRDQAKGVVEIHAPGSIDWSRGLEQSAAFITVRDPVVDSLASLAVHTASTLALRPLGGGNVAAAAAIFDALGVLGVVYQKDPYDPYPSISERAGAVDVIKYPRQTIEKRTGDCDDTTILLAALLQNAGIATKLVDVPGHLFLVFDSGWHERDRRYFGVREDLLVPADEGLWIPLETTALGRGFAEAWSQGARQFAASTRAGTIALVDVPAALARYETTLPPRAAHPPPIDVEALRRRLRADADTIGRWRAGYLDGLGERIALEPVSPDAEDVLAQASYRAGQIEDALRRLEQALARRPQSPRAHNNLGNVHAARGAFPPAIERYRRAAELDPADAGIWLNLGLVLHAAGDTAAAEAPLAEGLARSGGYMEACRLLGLPADAAADRAGGPRIGPAESRRLLQATLRRVPLLDSLRAQRRRPAPVQGSLPPVRHRVAASRAARPAGDDLRLFLYWRERE
jgi:hypothetical protein